MKKHTHVSFEKPKQSEEQLKKLKEFINKEKIKNGGFFNPIPFKGTDKKGQTFEYINESLEKDNPDH